MNTDKIILLPHIGGDGGHFIIHLIGKYISNVNNQQGYDFLYTDTNNYLGIWSPLWMLDRDGGYVCEYIIENINAGRSWYTDLVPILELDDNKWAFQQMHIDMSVLTYMIKRNSYYKNVMAMPIYAEDLQTQIDIFCLDIVKNDLGWDDLESKIRQRLDCVKRGHIQGYRGADTDKIKYVNYNALILRQDINELIKIADWLGETVVGDVLDIGKEIKEYANRNQVILETHSFNKTKMLEIAKYIYEDI